MASPSHFEEIIARGRPFDQFGGSVRGSECGAHFAILEFYAATPVFFLLLEVIAITGRLVLSGGLATTVRLWGLAK